jgi:hypothetical protein
MTWRVVEVEEEGWKKEWKRKRLSFFFLPHPHHPHRHHHHQAVAVAFDHAAFSPKKGSIQSLIPLYRKLLTSWMSPSSRLSTERFKSAAVRAMVRIDADVFFFFFFFFFFFYARNDVEKVGRSYKESFDIRSLWMDRR